MAFLSLDRESFAVKYCLTVTSAFVAETVTYPLDITKTRLQIQGEISKHVEKTVHSNPHRGMLATAFGIVREEGAMKLWQGLTPALYRHVVYSGCRVNFYEILREKVFKKNADGTFPVWKAATAGCLAGAAGQFFASPADLVKVNMQMEGKRRLEGKAARVKSAASAFRQIALEGGVRGLWRGWVPNVQRAALVNLGDLATYDTAKRFLLLKTSLKEGPITHCLSSLQSGFVSSLLSTPADVIKARVMNQPTRDGKGLLYSGSVDCIMKTIRQEGFFALYKGFLPTYTRLGPWYMLFWMTYEQVRKMSGTSAF